MQFVKGIESKTSLRSQEIILSASLPSLEIGLKSTTILLYLGLPIVKITLQTFSVVKTEANTIKADLGFAQKIVEHFTTHSLKKCADVLVATTFSPHLLRTSVRHIL